MRATGVFSLLLLITGLGVSAVPITDTEAMHRQQVNTEDRGLIAEAHDYLHKGFDDYVTEDIENDWDSYDDRGLITKANDYLRKDFDDYVTEDIENDWDSYDEKRRPGDDTPSRNDEQNGKDPIWPEFDDLTTIGS